jgi:polar amino acid transport system substrate-binding protein
MKKLFIVIGLMIVIVFLNFGLSEGKTLKDILKAGKIVVGVKGDFPPWGVINAQGNFEGWEIDLCRKLAEYLFGDPNKVEFVATVGGNRIPFLESGKIDIVWCTMGYTPKRAKKVDYSIRYFMSGTQMLVKRGSAIKQPEDLNGKTVIAIKGTIPAQATKKLAPNAHYIEFDKTSEALQALRDDRGVAFVQADLLLTKLAVDNPEFEVAGRTYAPEWWGVGFRKGEEDIKAYVNLAIMQMYTSGFLEDSLIHWWKGQSLEQIKEIVADTFTKGMADFYKDMELKASELE